MNTHNNDFLTQHILYITECDDKTFMGKGGEGETVCGRQSQKPKSRKYTFTESSTYKVFSFSLCKTPGSDEVKQVISNTIFLVLGCIDDFRNCREISNQGIKEL